MNACPDESELRVCFLDALFSFSEKEKREGQREESALRSCHSKKCKMGRIGRCQMGQLIRPQLPNKLMEFGGVGCGSGGGFCINKLLSCGGAE
jgi:hypothetical protein